ncbi:hypothetical protein E4T56_gene12972 [Termitomyces sp. T112]|nr:hypothetical protein E4T56_gene12972 [Termitomyces sp. T112]
MSPQPNSTSNHRFDTPAGRQSLRNPSESGTEPSSESASVTNYFYGPVYNFYGPTTNIPGEPHRNDYSSPPTIHMTLPPKRGDAGEGYAYIVEFGTSEKQGPKLNSTGVTSPQATATPPINQAPQPAQATAFPDKQSSQIHKSHNTMFSPKNVSQHFPFVPTANDKGDTRSALPPLTTGLRTSGGYRPRDTPDPEAHLRAGSLHLHSPKDNTNEPRQSPSTSTTNYDASTLPAYATGSHMSGRSMPQNTSGPQVRSPGSQHNTNEPPQSPTTAYDGQKGDILISPHGSLNNTNELRQFLHTLAANHGQKGDTVSDISPHGSPIHTNEPRRSPFPPTAYHGQKGDAPSTLPAYTSPYRTGSRMSDGSMPPNASGSLNGTSPNLPQPPQGNVYSNPNVANPTHNFHGNSIPSGWVPTVQNSPDLIVQNHPTEIGPYTPTEIVEIVPNFSDPTVPKAPATVPTVPNTPDPTVPNAAVPTDLRTTLGSPARTSPAPPPSNTPDSTVPNAPVPTVPNTSADLRSITLNANPQTPGGHLEKSGRSGCVDTALADDPGSRNSKRTLNANSDTQTQAAQLGKRVPKSSRFVCVQSSFSDVGTSPAVITESKETHSQSIPGSKETHNKSIPGSKETHNQSIPGSVETHNRSIPGSEETHNQSIPGSKETHNQSIPGSKETHNQSIPGSKETHNRSIPGSKETHHRSPSTGGQTKLSQNGINLFPSRELSQVSLLTSQNIREAHEQQKLPPGSGHPSPVETWIQSVEGPERPETVPTLSRNLGPPTRGRTQTLSNCPADENNVVWELPNKLLESKKSQLCGPAQKWSDYAFMTYLHSCPQVEEALITFGKTFADDADPPRMWNHFMEKGVHAPRLRRLEILETTVDPRPFLNVLHAPNLKRLIVSSDWSPDSDGNQ